MKIFNVDNGKKKVYVQLNDVMMLMQFDGIIPAEVMEKHFLGAFIVTDDNRYEFSEFTEPSTIKFFEECDWIVDYRDIKDLSEKEIIEYGQSIGEQMNEIAVRWNNMNATERENNEEVYSQYEKLEFKMHSVADIIHNKRGYLEMPFSIVPDSNGFKVDNDDCQYIAQQGLNPLQVLIYRKDGQVLDKEHEIIPQGLVEASQSILINYNLENNEYFGDFERTRKLSKDNKYLITTFRIIPVDEKDKVEEKDISNNDNMSLIKRIRNWWNRKRSN